MGQYKFVFRSVSRSGRQKVHTNEANSLPNAINKALMKHGHIRYYSKYNPDGKKRVIEEERVHIVKPKLKKMDLVSAIERAKKASKDGKRSYYITVDEKTGECDVSTAPIGTVTHKFVKGVEDKSFTASHQKQSAKEAEPKSATQGKANAPVKADAKNTNNQTTNVMKKSAANKSTTKKSETTKPSAKKAAKQKELPKPEKHWGKGQEMSIKDQIEKIKKGVIVRDFNGKIRTVGYLNRMNADFVSPLVYVGGTKDKE